MIDYTKEHMAERKRVRRDEQMRNKARKSAYRKKKNRLHRECFWTRPFGHVYKTISPWPPTCVGCGRKRSRGQ